MSAEEPDTPGQQRAPSSASDIYLIADELRGLATAAAQYAHDPYERERADQLRHLAARLAGVVDPGPRERLTGLFTDDAWAKVSPVLGVEAVVVDADGRVVLCRRRDSGLWCLPGGVCETGQSPTDAVLRELWEEAGIRGTVDRLVGVFDNVRWGGRADKAHVVVIVYLVRAEYPDPVPGTEMLAAGFCDPDRLPRLHPGHDQRIPRVLDLLATGDTHHDPASTLSAELPMHQRPET